MHIHPFLRVLYHFFRVVAFISTRVYFRHRTIIGRAHVNPLNGPAIIVANHPSTLMDVLLPGTYIPRVMFFLANYGLFKNPVSGWILRRLYCIPVKRREDVLEGESRNNDDAFEQSFEHLRKGGLLFIAGEGVSYMNRFIRPLKTGAARIALGAEARQNGTANVQIIPVGLSYNRPHLFRTTAVLQFGAPIMAADWLPAWKANSPAAVDQLTTHIEEQIKKLSIHCEDEAGELFVTRIEDMLDLSAPLPARQAFERTQQTIVPQLNNTALRTQTGAYFQQLEQLGISDRVVAGQLTLAQVFTLVLGWPLFLLAMLFWALPCYIPYWLNKKLNLYIGYYSTIKVLAGFFLSFPLMIWGVWHIGQPWYTAWWHFPAILIAFLLLGFVAEYYINCTMEWRASRQRKAIKTGVLSTLQKARQLVLAQWLP